MKSLSQLLLLRDNGGVHLRFLLGPAGTGKTFRCLEEIRAALRDFPDGPPLVLLAPKQATFQLERQLLSEDDLAGYTRLRILSFERLAEFVLTTLREPRRPMLSEEGRTMVLRALLTRRRADLQIFRGSAGLAGFARQLSLELRELQRRELSPPMLTGLASHPGLAEPLRRKLGDLAMLQRDYLDWLARQNLQDADSLLDLATRALRRSNSLHGEGNPSSPRQSEQHKNWPAECGLSPPQAGGGEGEIQAGQKLPSNQANDACVQERAVPGASPSEHRFPSVFRKTSDDLTLKRPEGRTPGDGLCHALWLEGFAEMTPQELSLLAAFAARCERVTLAFCVDAERSDDEDGWLSIWSAISQTQRDCWQRLSAGPGTTREVEVLSRQGRPGRFGENAALRHLEENWARPKPCVDNGAPLPLRAAVCANAEEEAVLAAREILRFVHAGGRFREAAVLVRSMEGYHDVLRRTFSRYEIPFFLDRREPVAHHPLAELTRNALRLMAFDWRHDDWFGALKTGLVSSEEEAIDRLENEALARGWKGETWTKAFPNEDGKMHSAERLRQEWTAPFLQLRDHFGKGGTVRPTGVELAESLRGLWRQLKIADKLGQITPKLPQKAENPQLHATVWQQMNAWLDNVALAFAGEALPWPEWLAILEAGLSGLTVGVIPPALDQVLIGAVDRSRNPDLKLALVLGLNESVFPAPPPPRHLLTESDCAELGECGVTLGPGIRQLLSREQFLGYIACTRARQRLVLTCSQRDDDDEALNPSPFFSHVKKLVPALEMESFAGPDDTTPEHACELIPRLLRAHGWGGGDELLALPAFVALREQMRFFAPRPQPERLAPAQAERLYGPALRTSVSRLEQFAACSFQYFVNSGLRAEERRLFELDARQKGSFQHLALAQFHEDLVKENKTWHGLSAGEARQRMARACAELTPSFEAGLLAVDARSRFAARTMARALEDFVAAMVEWMSQYEFEPRVVEVEFGGKNGGWPAWELDLGSGHRLVFTGRIDRIDLCPIDDGSGPGKALAVVIDYKSSRHKLDRVFLRHGLQLQLPAYLSVLRRLADPAKIFGVTRLVPAGVFYVNLRGNFKGGETRNEVLRSAEPAWQAAYQHAGRFDLAALPHLDNRGEARGTQFNFRLKKDGQPYANCPDPMDPAEFTQFLDQVEESLLRMGRQIFDGVIELNPYQKGTERACQYCEYQGICRIDPWTHSFRLLDEGDSNR